MSRKDKAGQPKTQEAVRAGNILRMTREALGLSRQELSDRTGGVLGPSRIGNYEQGLRELGIMEAELLARVLGTKAAYLMGLITDQEHQLLKLPHEVHSAMLLASEAMQSTGSQKQERVSGRATEIHSKPARLHRR